MRLNLTCLNLKEASGKRTPLSPYLFILAMEFLSFPISTHVNNNNWKPFSLKNSDLKVSHLFFVDDVLIFAKADSLSIPSIKNILNEFCLVIGMDINFKKKKSKLWLSPYISIKKKTFISNSLGIIHTPNLGTYLDYPLKPKYSTSDFNYIIHKLQSKLQGWKMNSLGRKMSTNLLYSQPNSKLPHESV